MIRVRGGNCDRSVRKIGQTMNQFVQVTLLKITPSHMESVKTVYPNDGDNLHSSILACLYVAQDTLTICATS